MASDRSDTILWISLCAFGILGAYTATIQLQAVRKASRVTERVKTPDLISQHTEDALKLDTLRELAFGSNQDIRIAARKIIIERVTQESAFKLLLQNVAGKNLVRRDESLASLRYLSTCPIVDKGSANQTFETVKALVKCLCNMTNKTIPEPHGETTMKHRAQPEKDALQVLYLSSRNNLRDALQAGLVSHWLVNYPFGGLDTPKNMRIGIVQKLRTGQIDDVMMNRIIEILDNEEGKRELRKYNLMGSDFEEMPDDDSGLGQSMLSTGTGRGDSDTRALHQLGNTTRRHEESAAEQARRRRRREAMVISEGEGPLGRENIIQGRRYDD